MQAKKILSESLEDYLEVILEITQEKKVARVKEIARKMGVKNSSVTGALRLLKEKNLIHYTPYEAITLTKQGEEAAEEVIRRHQALCDFFVKILCTSKEEGETIACKMEHSISLEILEKFLEFVVFMDLCHYGGAKWIEGQGYQCRKRELGTACQDCRYLEILAKRHKTKQGQ